MCIEGMELDCLSLLRYEEHRKMVQIQMRDEEKKVRGILGSMVEQIKSSY